jgi:hypothetical protein
VKAKPGTNGGFEVAVNIGTSKNLKNQKEVHMPKTEMFSKLLDKNIEVEFSRGAIENKPVSELFYSVRVVKEPAKIPLTMKRNTMGHWGIEDRRSIPIWVSDLEPQLIRAIKENEA